MSDTLLVPNADALSVYFSDDEKIVLNSLNDFDVERADFIALLSHYKSVSMPDFEFCYDSVISKVSSLSDAEFKLLVSVLPFEGYELDEDDTEEDN